MKAFKLSLLPAIAILMLFNTSCKKKPIAGFGGNTHVRLFAKHHDEPIDSVTFFIKFNASDIPSNGIYDTSQKAVIYSAGNAYALFNGLKKGYYYIYAKGWDSAENESVKGGLPYFINEDGNLDITLAVTE